MTVDDSQDSPVAHMRLSVNGVHRDIEVPDDEALVTSLRKLGFTSVRAACGIGMCGTCTVQVDGMVASSCLLLTRQVSGCELVTSEGLVEDGALSEVQQAFLDHRAYQCSFCIPGMVLTVDACLRSHPSATVSDVREYLSGNLCRCGTYPSILEAVHALVAARTAGGDVR